MLTQRSFDIRGSNTQQPGKRLDLIRWHWLLAVQDKGEHGRLDANLLSHPAQAKTTVADHVSEHHAPLIAWLTIGVNEKFLYTHPMFALGFLQYPNPPQGLFQMLDLLAIGGAASVAYAIQCADRDAWTEAAEAYRISTGPAHIEARRVFRPMVLAEQERLRRGWAELRAAVQRQRAA